MLNQNREKEHIIGKIAKIEQETVEISDKIKE